MHCRKIEFGIHKLKEEEKKWNEEAENRIREVQQQLFPFFERMILSSL
jgi:hypothetical protein